MFRHKAPKTIPARALDLALGGMKIAGPCADMIGKPATIVLPRHGRTLKGRICWAGASMAGVRFTVPLATADLAALLTERSPPPRD